MFSARPCCIAHPCVSVDNSRCTRQSARGAFAVPVHVAFTPCRLVMRPPGCCRACVSPAVAQGERRSVLWGRGTRMYAGAVVVVVTTVDWFFGFLSGEIVAQAEHFCALTFKDLAALPALAGVCTVRLCAAASRGTCAVPAQVAFTPCRLAMRPPGRCRPCVSPAVAQPRYLHQMGNCLSLCWGERTYCESLSCFALCCGSVYAMPRKDGSIYHCIAIP